MAKPTKKTTTKNPTGTTTTQNTPRSGTTHRSAATGKFVKSTGGRASRTTVTERNVAVDAETDTTMEALAALEVRGVDRADPNGWAIVPAALSDEVDVDEATIERLVAEVDQGIPEEKLRRRGRPSIGPEASSTYSVRLPDDLVALVDERSAVDGISRGETMRRALIDYLTR